jgi:hypothetical protein
MELQMELRIVEVPRRTDALRIACKRHWMQSIERVQQENFIAGPILFHLFHVAPARA